MKRSILIIIILFSMFSIESSSKTDYRYAHSWHSSIDFVIEEGKPVNLTKDDDLEHLLLQCKEMINLTDLKNNYPFFNMELFEDVKISYADGIECSKGIISEGINGKYFKSLNLICIFPNCTGYGESYVSTIIIHELIHVLTYSEQSVESMLLEGIADYFAMEISEIYDLPFQCMYINELYCFEYLCSLFGKNATVQMIFEGSLDSKIDELTENGMGKKFSQILLIINQMEGSESDIKELDKLQKVELDILCHMTYNYCQNIDNKKRESILSSCRKMLINEDKYFVDLLK